MCLYVCLCVSVCLLPLFLPPRTTICTTRHYHRLQLDMRKVLNLSVFFKNAILPIQLKRPFFLAFFSMCIPTRGHVVYLLRVECLTDDSFNQHQDLHFFLQILTSLAAPLHYTYTYIASVLCTCISMYMYSGFRSISHLPYKRFL